MRPIHRRLIRHEPLPMRRYGCNPHWPKLILHWAKPAANYQALRNFPDAAKAFERGAAADPNFFMNRCLRAHLDIDWRGDTGPMERLLVEIPESLDPDGEVTLARFALKLFQR